MRGRLKPLLFIAISVYTEVAIQSSLQLTWRLWGGGVDYPYLVHTTLAPFPMNLQLKDEAGNDEPMRIKSRKSRR